ncbi:hypothetical protein [Halopseudomonas pelagia]|uniref:Integrase n=1 Tax=Halopseudomonas pelagia TaxID=553151 RepID=A0AA91U1X0_9GAMM|nr:hypothetical protein [Halopseudomonas pelagia]PCC99037.1 hypothetical protein CO192_12470 [Halopseudomonas pelagia]QFY57644.1 hypothetical protein EAO82_15475 [Halopseudomonas pelagia]
MLNKYLDRLEKLIHECQKQKLTQFCGPEEKMAQWSDLVWYHIDPNTGRKVRFLCGRHGLKGKAGAGNRSEYALRHPYDQLIKIWIIEVNNMGVSAGHRQALVVYARRLLSEMQGELYSQNTSSLVEFMSLYHHQDRIANFIEFCIAKGLMPKISIPRSVDKRDRTGHAVFDSRVDSMPKVEVIQALGTIHHQIFQTVSQNGSVSTGSEINMLDAFVSTAALLGLASPNRISAELPLIPSQQLNTFSESENCKVYYLDWPGSKGFKNNRNHILAALAPEVERAVNFFFLACEPARVLCRFYENPRQSLRTLLGRFKVSNAASSNLNFDTVPNLFVLGYALGFYEVDAIVPVILPRHGVPQTAHKRGKVPSCFTDKPIHALESNDLLSTSIYSRAQNLSIPTLMGYQTLSVQGQRILGCAGKTSITVGELQDNWIRYFTTTLLPEFPDSFAASEGKIRLKNALFCLLGSQVYGRSAVRSGGRVLSRSHYNITPMHSLSSQITGRLRGGNWWVTIFESYGFEGLSLKPHSLRHFGNTLAELSDIPREIITAWSGRKDKEQTEAYLHRRHEEQPARVRTVMDKSDPKKREIRVVARESIKQIANLPATVTSSGVCTQELNLNPCEYLNDFVTQCFMCSAACHIAGDAAGIELFQKDYQVQVARLDNLKADRRMRSSIAMQRWFVIHSKNTYVLASLLDLMNTLRKGTIIRYSPGASEFHVTDVDTKKCTKSHCHLPDVEEELRILLTDQSDDKSSTSNPQLISLLSTFGLSGGEG